MNFEDEDELIGGTGGGSRNRNKAKKGKTANASGAGGGGKAPKTHDIGVLISGKLPSLLPRIETTLNTLRSTLSDSLQLVLEQDTDVTKTYKKLVEKKIMETDIDECIKSGKGPHGFGPDKDDLQVLLSVCETGMPGVPVHWRYTMSSCRSWLC